MSDKCDKASRCRHSASEGSLGSRLKFRLLTNAFGKLLARNGCSVILQGTVLRLAFTASNAFGNNLDCVAGRHIIQKLQQAIPVEGPAVGGRKTRMRGGAKVTTTVKAAVEKRALAGCSASETPAKRTPVLPKGRANGGEKPVPRVKTSRALPVLKKAALPRKTNTRVQDPGPADKDCSGRWSGLVWSGLVWSG